MMFPTSKALSILVIKVIYIYVYIERCMYTCGSLFPKLTDPVSGVPRAEIRVEPPGYELI